MREEKAQEQHGHFGLRRYGGEGIFPMENHHLALTMWVVWDPEVGATEDLTLTPLLPREYSRLLSTKHFKFWCCK